MKNIVKVFKRSNFKKYIISAHDVSDGGLAVALSECCILSSKGAIIELEDKNIREDNLLFSEWGSRIIFSINKEEEVNFANFIKSKLKSLSQNMYIKKIGFVTNEIFKISSGNNELCNIRVEELTKKFNNSISSYF